MTVRIVAPVRASDVVFSAAEDVWDACSRMCRRVATIHAADQGKQLAVVVLALVLTLLWPVSTPDVPERVVHLPGGEWVDAATVAGLPVAAPDGASLRYAWECSESKNMADSGLNPEIVAAGQAALGGKVHLNAASVATLERLPGVGPALAARIVAGRPYTRVEELDKVRGIGQKTFAKLEPLVEP